MVKMIPVTVLVCIMMSSYATAQDQFRIEYTTTKPNNRVIYGCLVTYRLVGNSPGSQATWRWSYRLTTGNCSNTWRQTTSSNAQPTEECAEVYPGAFQVRCRVTFQPDSSGSAPEPINLYTNISVPPPDGVRVNSGNRVVVNGGTASPIVFGILCQGFPVDYAIGLPQENIINGIDQEGKWPNQGFTTKTSTKFKLVNSIIYDSKNPGYVDPFLPKGAVLFTCVQQLQIRIPDLCGGTKDYLLPPNFNVLIRKMSEPQFGSSLSTYRVEID